MYDFDYAVMWRVFKACIRYLPVTCYIALWTMAISIVFGILLAVMRTSKNVVLTTIARAYILVMRGIPTIVFLILLYRILVKLFDGIGATLGIGFNSSTVPLYFYAVLALSLGEIAFMSETVRTALLSVPQGQLEAAYSVGMKKSLALRRIVIPQALPVALPILGNNLINLIKATSLVNTIAVIDLMAAARIEVNANYRYLEAYVVSALIYWLITIVIERAVKYLTIYTTKKVGMEAYAA